MWKKPLATDEGEGGIFNLSGMGEKLILLNMSLNFAIILVAKVTYDYELISYELSLKL